MVGSPLLKIGVLALQGAVREHVRTLTKAGAEAFPIKRVEELRGLDGLVIPGGESTAIGLLMEHYGFFEAITEEYNELPIFGSCAGMILLAKDISGSAQPRLGFMDITVNRNGFGRQRESFEEDLIVPILGAKPLRAVYIRAPFATSVGENVTVLATTAQDRIVLARQGRYLVSAFHAELTDDLRLHEYFLKQVVSTP